VKELLRRSLKPDGSYEPQLVINEMTLLPGGEWSPQLRGWMLIHVCSGAGYWLHPRMNWELQQGAVVLLSDQAQGYVRASQAGGLRLQFFRMEPRRLTGLVSMADQTLMQNAAADEKLSLRVLPPDARFSDKFNELSSDKARNSFPARVQLLQLFLDVFGGNFQQPPPEVTEVVDAKERLKQLLDHTPVSEFLELSFPELVGRTACSPRHVSRLFTELVGVSFREKQAELRLTRACDLLATTDFKVVDVAMESGFQSTSLFSAMFKQRFGTSPARWRERARRRKPAKRAVRRLRVVA
jgi:AraC-like DNA-binding protein